MNNWQFSQIMDEIRAFHCSDTVKHALILFVLDFRDMEKCELTLEYMKSLITAREAKEWSYHLAKLSFLSMIRKDNRIYVHYVYSTKKLLPKPCWIYWIRLNTHTDPMTEGYIGRSVNPADRLMEHILTSLPNKNARKAIEEAGWHNISMSLLHKVSDTEKGLILENKYRPSRNIGWNVHAGG